MAKSSPRSSGSRKATAYEVTSADVLAALTPPRIPAERLGLVVKIDARIESLCTQYTSNGNLVARVVR